MAVLISRFDGYRLAGATTGYVVAVQSKILLHLLSRTVLPLFTECAVSRATLECNSVFEFEEIRSVLFTQLIVTVEVKEVKRQVGSLVGLQDEIKRALDVLLTGF